MVDQLIKVVCVTYSLQMQVGPTIQCRPARAAAPGAMDGHGSSELAD